MMGNRWMFRRCSPIIYTCLPPEIHPHGQNATIIQEIMDISSSIMVHLLVNTKTLRTPIFRSIRALLEFIGVCKLKSRCLSHLPLPTSNKSFVQKTLVPQLLTTTNVSGVFVLCWEVLRWSKREEFDQNRALVNLGTSVAVKQHIVAAPWLTGLLNFGARKNFRKGVFITGG